MAASHVFAMFLRTRRPWRADRPARRRRGCRRPLTSLLTALRLVTAACLTAGAVVALPAPSAAASVPLERVTNFGDNPGDLAMYVYRPAEPPANPPVVLALHGCTQDARVYADNSGLPELADRHGFLLVLAETSTTNNLNRCFNWFQPLDNRRDTGEAASLRQMVDHAVTAYGADPARAYATGLSAGGAMTAVLLATHPDVFAAGAVVAGLPYHCARDSGPFTCMSPGVDHTPEDWARRARDAHPEHDGPWPRVQIWQGEEDTTVVPGNAAELRDQWTAVHGLPQTPDRTDQIGPNGTSRAQYLTADGEVAVEVAMVPDIGHGTPVDPGDGPEQCGATGTEHFLPSLCASHWITTFFGIDATAAARS